MQIVAAASTTEKVLRVNLTNHRNKDAAASVGRAVAQRSIAAGISAVHFNRPKGNRFHGKLRMLIDNMARCGASTSLESLAVRNFWFDVNVECG